MESYNSYTPKREDKFVPFKRYTFAVGDLGGEIRVSIPLTASPDDIRTAADMIAVLAESWKGADE